MPKIIILGASTTYGCWDEEGGWVSRLRKFLDQKNFTYPKERKDKKFIVYNLGVSSATTDDLLRRAEFEFNQRVKIGQEIIVIFSVGTNDAQLDISLNDLRVLPDKFLKNVEKLIEVAKKFTSKIVFIGVTPIDETQTNPILWNQERSCKNKTIDKYNNIVKNICREKNVYFVDIFNEWVKKDYKELLDDGMHPNTRGHEEIYKKVLDFLIKNGIIDISTTKDL